MAYSNYLNFTLFGIYCRRIMISVFTSKLILNLTPIFFWLQIGASIQPFLWNFSSKFIQHCQILVHFIFHKIWYKYQGRKKYLFLAFYWHFTSLCNIVLSAQATEWALLHLQAASILKQTSKHQERKIFYFWPFYCHFVPLCLAPKLQSERCFIRKLHPY